MMWYSDNGMHWWGWLIGALAMLAFWVLIAWAIWYAVKSLSRRNDQAGPGRPSGTDGLPADPKRILDERLARGEIDTEEYIRLRDLLAERSTSVKT